MYSSNSWGLISELRLHSKSNKVFNKHAFQPSVRVITISWMHGWVRREVVGLVSSSSQKYLKASCEYNRTTCVVKWRCALFSQDKKWQENLSGENLYKLNEYQTLLRRISFDKSYWLLAGIEGVNITYG